MDWAAILVDCYMLMYNNVRLDKHKTAVLLLVLCCSGVVVCFASV